MSSKILVTGNAGFIGLEVTNLLLKSGYEVVGVDIRNCTNASKSFRHYKCDINDYEQVHKVFKKESPFRVIHLAARIDLDGKRLEDYQTNILGNENVIKCCQDSNVDRIVVTSSRLVCEVGYVPKHDQDFKPSTVYGESKIETEKITRKLLEGGPMTWVIGRPTTVWGPGMGEHYERFFRFVKKGLYFHSGRKELFKSYSYIENIAFQYLQLVSVDQEKVNGKVFYLADYDFLSMNYYIDTVANLIGARKVKTLPLPLAKSIAFVGDITKALGLPSPFNSFRLKNILTEFKFDLNPTREVCGDLPVSIDQGIERTSKWLNNKWNAS